MFGPKAQNLDATFKPEKPTPKPGDGFTGASKPQNANTANDQPAPQGGTVDLNSPVAATAFVPGAGAIKMPQQNANTLLHRLRSRFHNLPVIPTPDTVRSMQLTANTPADINLPDGTVAILITADNPVFISMASRAAVPSNTTFTENNSDSICIIQPCNWLFFTGMKKQFSAIATVTTHISVLCFLDKPASSDEYNG